MENEEMFYEDQDVDAIEDSQEQYDEAVAFVRERFNRAKDKKLADEERFLRCYRNFRGLYGPDVQFSENEKSRVFVKVTKTKVLAAYGQITEVLFGQGQFPISVDQTKLPDGVSDSVHFDPQEPPQTLGQMNISNIYFDEVEAAQIAGTIAEAKSKTRVVAVIAGSASFFIHFPTSSRQ